MIKTITRKELASLFNVSERTIDRWRQELGLPFVKIGRLIRFDEEKVLCWFNRRFTQNV